MIASDSGDFGFHPLELDLFDLKKYQAKQPAIAGNRPSAPPLVDPTYRRVDAHLAAEQVLTVSPDGRYLLANETAGQLVEEWDFKRLTEPVRTIDRSIDAISFAKTSFYPAQTAKRMDRENVLTPGDTIAVSVRSQLADLHPEQATGSSATEIHQQLADAVADVLNRHGFRVVIHSTEQLPAIACDLAVRVEYVETPGDRFIRSRDGSAISFHVDEHNRQIRPTHGFATLRWTTLDELTELFARSFEYRYEGSPRSTNGQVRTTAEHATWMRDRFCERLKISLLPPQTIDAAGHTIPEYVTRRVSDP